MACYKPSPSISNLLSGARRDGQHDPIGRGEAANRINQSATQICFLQLEYLGHDEQKEWRKRVFRNACRLAMGIPALSCVSARAVHFGKRSKAICGC